MSQLRSVKYRVKKGREEHVFEGHPEDIHEIYKKIVKGKVESSQRRTLDGKPIPSPEEIVEYIKTQPQYEHSIRSVSKKFLGKPLPSTGKPRKDYLNLKAKILEARRIIVAEEGKEWMSKRGTIDKRGKRDDRERIHYYPETH